MIDQAKKKDGRFKLKAAFFDFPEFWLNSPGDLLLAGAPDRVRGRHQRLPAGGADRQVQGRVAPTGMSDRPVHIGCSGWNYADWRGAVYPPGCPPRRWLAHYATLFGTVEVNSTFYRLARPEAVARWVADTPPGFVFTVKSSRYLTHVRRLQDMGRGVERLYAGIAPLVGSGKLGPVLWQLPANFHRDDDRLAFALERLPPGRHCFEFRHRSWFCPEVYGLLHTFGVAHGRRRRSAPSAAGARR